MKASAFHLFTTRETPAEAEIVSHQLMLRSGMIRKLTSGIYTWTPLGLRVLRKVENIVREELDRAGYQELLMPAVQPSELWVESGRWEKFGAQLLKIKDRAGRDYCFGPTHEEVVTDFVRNEIKSYKQLPITFYQIQTKFRDEIRPRFGVMRAREFLMKDAYSFHIDEQSLDETYWDMYEVYVKIFTRTGLRFRSVEADTGAIGGHQSHEFHVLADSGEDEIAFSDARGETKPQPFFARAFDLAYRAERPDRGDPEDIRVQAVRRPIDERRQRRRRLRHARVAEHLHGEEAERVDEGEVLRASALLRADRGHGVRVDDLLRGGELMRHRARRPSRSRRCCRAAREGRGGTRSRGPP